MDAIWEDSYTNATEQEGGDREGTSREREALSNQ